MTQQILAEKVRSQARQIIKLGGIRGRLSGKGRVCVETTQRVGVWLYPATEGKSVGGHTCTLSKWRPGRLYLEGIQVWSLCH